MAAWQLEGDSETDHLPESVEQVQPQRAVKFQPLDLSQVKKVCAHDNEMDGHSIKSL